MKREPIIEAIPDSDMTERALEIDDIVVKRGKVMKGGSSERRGKVMKGGSSEKRGKVVKGGL